MTHNPSHPLVNYVFGKIGLMEYGAWVMVAIAPPPTCPSLTQEQGCGGFEGCQLLLESGWNICLEDNN